MKITKAVIPAAGLGTRVLPATKSMPKEMLTIVDKPAIQYIIEEAVASGITDILIITNRGKGVIEDHFDISAGLEDTLRKAGKTEQLRSIENLHKLANIHYIRQIETKGLGHAVSRARTFVGDDPFVVMYGDDVIIGDIPATKELVDAYGTFGKGVLGIKPVSEEAIKKYSSLKVENIHDNVFPAETLQMLRHIIGIPADGLFRPFSVWLALRIFSVYVGLPERPSHLHIPYRSYAG